jgi:copper chaperone NosL
MRNTAANVCTRALIAVTALLLVGCSEDTSLAPPEILYGQQECERCRMIISDERFATAMIVEQPGGTRTAFAFDDINCLFEHERQADGWTILARYVHDVNTRQWLDTSGAVFLLSERIETPMASGVAAAAAIEGLNDLQREHAGAIRDFDAIRTHFMTAGASTAMPQP